MATTLQTSQARELPVANRSDTRASLPSSDRIVSLVIAGDFVVASCAFTLAIVNRAYWDFGLDRAGFVPGDYFGVVPMGSILYLGILHFVGAHDKHLFLDKFQTISLIFKASVYWALIFILGTLVLELRPSMSRLFSIWSFCNSLVFVTVWRLTFLQFLYVKDWALILTDRVMVVGWSKESDMLAKQIAREQGHPYRIIGCTPSAHGKFWATPPRYIPVLGDYNETRELLLQHKPNILIMADLDPVMGEIISLAQLCTREHVQFKVIPSFFQIFASGLHLENISGVPVMGVSKLPLDYIHNRFLKRALDIVGSLVGLALSLPLIAIFGSMIYRESPGPIFYRQTRSGQGRALFQIFKLRSMKLNAEANGPQWTVADDPRRLKIGELMRRWNIDEVPQFWNVLCGDMSLVGPRPERPELINKFKEEINHYNARHIAKPGITGYAQINGMRGNTDLRERIRYDLYYVENWTVWLDIYIMIQTFFPQKNAY